MFSCGATLTAAESMLDGEANGQPPDPDCRLVGARDPRRRLASIRVIELEKETAVHRCKRGAAEPIFTPFKDARH
jgi:hypothetical protein